jgi:hypothetical protein
VLDAATGSRWIGTDQGLLRLRDGKVTYLAGPRWLPDDRILDLAGSRDGVLKVMTAVGEAWLREQPLTLPEKAALYQRNLEARPRRYGFVTLMQLPELGRLEGALQEIADNDGLWTALYVAAQSFRYAVTGEASAREQASHSMAALLRLESITGIPGFPARALAHPEEPGYAGRSVGEWNPSPVEAGWMWKGDTSSDEIDGHYFAFHIFNQLAADADEAARVRDACRRITDHLLGHGLYLVDQDGKPTRWGVWAPERLNDDPDWEMERGLNSLEILSHLKVAAEVVGDPRYEAAYRELVEEHGYARNTLDAKITAPSEINHSDDELAFLSYYPLLMLERDPELRSVYQESLRRYWEFERREECPLWNFIYGACTGDPCDAESTRRALEEMPLDLIDWPVRNSHRQELRLDPHPDRFGQPQLLAPLPWPERPLHKWNGNPFLIDGGSGLIEEDQTVWLLPYWLGRYHELI